MADDLVGEYDAMARRLAATEARLAEAHYEANRRGLLRCGVARVLAYRPRSEDRSMSVEEIVGELARDRWFLRELASFLGDEIRRECLAGDIPGGLEEVDGRFRIGRRAVEVDLPHTKGAPR